MSHKKAQHKDSVAQSQNFGIQSQQSNRSSSSKQQKQKGQSQSNEVSLKTSKLKEKLESHDQTYKKGLSQLGGACFKLSLLILFFLLTMAAFFTVFLAWKDLEKSLQLNLNPSVLFTLNQKSGDAIKLDNEIQNQSVELAFQEFVKEAAKNGIINEVGDYINQDQYDEVFSRLALIGNQLKENKNPKIHGIENCYQKKVCAGVEVLVNLFKNRYFKEASKNQLWKDIGHKVANVQKVARKYQKINELIQ